jgi:hypothetical protein
MKTWQIFAGGTAVLLAALFLPSYEAILAGAAAVVMVTAVATGFLLRTRRDIFYIRTTLVIAEPDHPISVEHDRIAVRVEQARLWLLFLPKFGALAFLVVTSAQDTTWKFSLLDRFWDVSTYSVFYVVRIFLFAVIRLFSNWVSERWVLRDAEACSAGSISVSAGQVRYSFRDRLGEYYGGEGFQIGSAWPRQLATIVLYRACSPDLNRIAMGCLFHRLVIVGRGLIELDESTAAAHSIKTQPASQPV